METEIPHLSSVNEIVEEKDDSHSSPNGISADPLPINNEALTNENENEEGNKKDHAKETNKLQKLIQDGLRFIEDDLNKYMTEVERQLKGAKEKLKSIESTQQQEPQRLQQLLSLQKSIMKLKTEIPSEVKSEPKAKDNTMSKEKVMLGEIRDKSSFEDQFEQLASFYKKDMFKSSEIFKEFEASFNLLDLQHKLCLLCFAAFPENAIVKKRLLMYWWIGEGFIPSGENEEANTEKILAELISKNFIEPVYDKCPFKRKAHSYKSQPLAHAAVTMLAERENFFDFDDKGNPRKVHSRSLRACLQVQSSVNIAGENRSDSGKHQDEEEGRIASCSNEMEKKTIVSSSITAGRKKNRHVDSSLQDAEKRMAHVVFNLRETSLRFEPNWLADMKFANILYLGKWENTAELHIEVEDPNVLNSSLSGLKYVKFLSLQGISGITEIPDSISKLWHLRILDLRACHDLEIIPERISSLLHLTHLDISECYLLNHMPKGLSALKNLVVFKGFEVRDSKDKSSCTLEDLKEMKKLRKLSIYTEIKDFPREADLNALKLLKELRILTIEWRGNPFRDSDSKTNLAMRGLQRSNASANDPGFPPCLNKLDLKCFPRRSARSWLKPDNLRNLKQLYIRGGELRDLGQIVYFKDNEPQTGSTQNYWKLETLRLKYLAEIEMDWTELQKLFPALKFLEKVKCPKLTMFPCNGYGVWVEKKMTF